MLYQFINVGARVSLKTGPSVTGNQFGQPYPLNQTKDKLTSYITSYINIA